MTKFTINGYRLELTCGACPEQYDVFLGEELVAYLRLRHGWFYAACPYVGGTVVYEAYPKGDGMFEDDEREFYLTEAIKAICSHQFKVYANRETYF